MEIGKCLRRYVENSKPGIAKSVLATVKGIIPEYIETFSYQEHTTGLLMGEVQSGKTAQMFGIMAAAADLGFKLFILLTTDNVYLQQQTYKRALAEMEDDFNVCDETDVDRFIQGGLRRPVLVILKKNSRVLGTWRDNLASSGYCTSNPLFIFDDEADASSLNTRINQNQQSAINSHLESIRSLANSSIYLQVTATPQSVILQSADSEWSPSFIHYFPPGKGYLGGAFYYSEPRSFAIRLTGEEELEDLLEGDGITPALEASLMSFLIASAHLLHNEFEKVCNFLIHPSVKIDHHEVIADKVKEYILNLPSYLSDQNWLDLFYEAWLDLQGTKPDLLKFEKIIDFLAEKDDINVLLMNSNSEIATYENGMNIIVGGNSLGRGVTFPVLQTVYYCRSSRRPQADTFWQHCRMFGYDRDPNLVRLFIPLSLLNLFTELNNANETLVRQIQDSTIPNIGLLYPTNVNPTRRNVVDKDLINIIAGGTNYFPKDPKEDNLTVLDSLLSIPNGEYNISYAEAAEILKHCEANDLGSWGSTAFVDCLNALSVSEDNTPVRLIVRRGRNISKGTGTLLAPNDRSIGNGITNGTVLTMYRLEGESTKGWLGAPFWIPNIKFASGRNFHITTD